MILQVTAMLNLISTLGLVTFSTRFDFSRRREAPGIRQLLDFCVALSAIKTCDTIIEFALIPECRVESFPQCWNGRQKVWVVRLYHIIERHINILMQI